MSSVPVIESRTCVRCRQTDVWSCPSTQLRSAPCVAPSRVPAGYTIDSVEVTAVGLCAGCRPLALDIQQGA